MASDGPEVEKPEVEKPEVEKPEVEKAVDAAADAVDAAVDDAVAKVDDALDELTGVPTDDGEIEEFAYDGATLIAERRGDAASSRTVVLVHGIGMGRKVFADLTRHLERDACVVALDLPGYGDAPEPPRTPTMERLGDLVAAYLRHLDRGPVTLIGHSMGTQVVTETAVRHPATVRRLVLVAPTVDRHHRNAFSQLWRLGLDLLGESPRVLIMGAREYVRAGPNLRRKMTAMLVHRPEHSYPRIAAPTLVIRGEGDRCAPPRWCDEVVDAIPNAESVEIAGHGHETLIRDAGPAAEAIRPFAGV